LPCRFLPVAKKSFAGTSALKKDIEQEGDAALDHSRAMRTPQPNPPMMFKGITTLQE
jgi:hypothetical protein